MHAKIFQVQRDERVTSVLAVNMKGESYQEMEILRRLFDVERPSDTQRIVLLTRLTGPITTHCNPDYWHFDDLMRCAHSYALNSWDSIESGDLIVLNKSLN